MTAHIPTPSVIPYLFYDEPVRMRDFLVDAFGFTAVSTHRSPAGEVANIELRMGEKYLMLGRARPEMDFVAPSALPAAHSGVLVYVDDVDAHFTHARTAGARIRFEPEDMPYGQREYSAHDPENGFWSFATLQ